eukprot:CAMPEP_0197832264 /NCGR_PEP_ID=MMETSP1437-20131217/13971_1 /TAXON_ID=49252 ORGANISM="Eucampia antarctica, Strain CCMP1452" /NCGR_SAMPLE_ID=MMETSP1437 /ASSEMBLY_ACC=CAM_ASM_001096 /LENGTH=77 /DNA_ID=CAMNT_0043435547 /DNA_START=65 /DNA_END=298 /DNA_ORIENTATION=+
MKFAIAALFVGSAAAFVPSTLPAFALKPLCMSKIVTGAQGKPAKSQEEDMELTLKVIFKDIADETNDESDESPAKEE